MFAAKIFKNPILAVGILLFCIFLWNLKNRGKMTGFTKRYLTESCTAVVADLEKDKDDRWDLHCKENNLILKVDSELPGPDIKRKVYRDLANIIISIGKKSPDVLEKVDAVIVRYRHPTIHINTWGTGEAIYQFREMNDQGFMMKHLQGNVKIQEISK